jgi:hypothetical protein
MTQDERDRLIAGVATLEQERLEAMDIRELMGENALEDMADREVQEWVDSYEAGLFAMSDAELLNHAGKKEEDDDNG